jgi:hypothetical protein
LYVVTLEDFVPPERADGVHWTQAKIEEAPAVGGAWTLIDTIAVVVGDPMSPAPQTLTTAQATQAAGWYRVTWADAVGGLSQPTVPVNNAAATGLSPTVAEVGALLRARTKTSGGAEVGTFTNATRPTGSEVAVLIDEAVEDITGQIGTPEPGSPLERRARRAAALYAAVLVETSYFPEQVAQGRSVADTYLKLYNSRLAALVKFVEQGGDAGDADGSAGAADADLAFDTQIVVDDVVYGLPPIGWGTRW